MARLRPLAEGSTRSPNMSSFETLTVVFILTAFPPFNVVSYMFDINSVVRKALIRDSHKAL